jgi:Tfp pilus assembly protein PilN
LLIDKEIVDKQVILFMQKKLYGIVPAPDGSFVQVKISEEKGVWKVDSVLRRDVNDTIRNILLFDKKISLGIHAHWVHKDVPDYLSLISAHASFGDFNVCTPTTDYNLYFEAVKSNLGGVYPDDAYLCTLPIHLTPRISHSFVTVARDGDIYKVGVVIQLQLVAVFSVAAVDNRQLNGFLSRIYRYWTMLDIDFKYPGTIILLNCPDVTLNNEEENVQHLSFYPEDVAIVKATGVALCEIEDGVPALSKETPECKVRNVRSGFVLSSVALVCISLLVFFIATATNLYLKTKIDSGKKVYNTKIEQNREIRELFKHGTQLAQQIASLDSAGAKRSSWAKLLHYIGSNRPAGLFVDKLGTDKSDKTGEFRVAITGWAGNEIAVTEMMKRLNGSPVVANAVLQSMQQDPKKNNYFIFKIICLLKSEK